MRRSARRGQGVARGVVAALLTSTVAVGWLSPSAVSAAPGDVTAVAGGLGAGQALSVGMLPGALAVRGSVLYAGDQGVIRSIDLVTGAVRVVAGNGDSKLSGDGGPATAAGGVFGIGGIAVDGSGNLFFMSSSDRVRRVDPSGIITTVAGNGGSDFFVESGPATQISLLGVHGIAADGAGNLYITDTFASCVRRVTPAGFMTTVAGACGSSGSSGDGGPATAARLSQPGGIAADGAGNIYIADVETHAVRRVSAADGTIDTIGSSTGYSMAADASGNLFFGDENSATVQRIDGASHASTTFAGTGAFGDGGDGGPATAAQLGGVLGLAADGSGNVFISDVGNHRLRRVDPAGTITTIAGTGWASFSGDGGPATAAQLGGNFDRYNRTGVSRLAQDGNGNLYVADTLNDRVRRIALSGLITTFAGNGGTTNSGDGGPATAAGVEFSADVGSSGIAADTAGHVFIAAGDRVRKVDATGTITTFVSGLSAPEGMDVDAAGNLFIAEPGSNVVRKVSPSGAAQVVAGAFVAGFSGDGGPATAARLNQPRDVAVDGAGNLYIADSSNGRVRKVDAAGIITTVAGGGMYTRSLGEGGPATRAWVNAISVAVDTSGRLFIVGTGFGGNYKVRQVVGGVISTAYDAETLDDVLVDRSGGSVLVSGTGQGGFVRRIEAPVPVAPARFVGADFDGDFQTDPAVFRPDGAWYATGSSGSGSVATGYGATGDVAVAGDYDGDHRTDVAIYRPSTGLWAIHRSSGGDTFTTYGGVPGDVPVPADYDGDGKVDVAIYRPSVGTWFVRRSSDTVDAVETFGVSDDVPMPADYDGDHRADIAVFRPASGTWYVHRSSDSVETATPYGASGDVPVPADYDGDGHANLAIFRPSTGLWAIYDDFHADNVLLTYGGVSGDVPVPGDYDGDGQSDIAIFRPPSGAWYVHRSLDGVDTATTFGIPTDVPVGLPAAVRTKFFPPA